MRAIPLDPLAAGAIALLGAGIAALRFLLPDTVRLRIAPDLAALWTPATRPVVLRLRAVAAALARELVETRRGLDLRPAMDAAAEVLNSLPVESRDIEQHLEEGLRRAGELLCEVGYDQHNAFLDFAAGSNHQWAGGSLAVPPRAADAALLPRVYEHLMAWALQDPIAEVELAAAQWMFRGWAGPRHAGTLQAAAARLTRELEWLVLGRVMLGFQAPVAHAFLSRTGRTEPTTRQRDLIRALKGSLPGVFAVRRRRRDVTLVEDLLREARVEIVEHNDRLDYGPLDYAFGRLIPTGSGRYARSPGTVFWRPADASAGRGLVERLQAASADGVDPELCVEGALRAMQADAVVPDYEQPASSPEEAQATFDLFWRRLRAAGVGRVMPVEELPEERRAPVMAGDAEAREVSLDATMHLWLDALGAQIKG